MPEQVATDGGGCNFGPCAWSLIQSWGKPLCLLAAVSITITYYFSVCSVLVNTSWWIFNHYVAAPVIIQKLHTDWQ